MSKQEIQMTDADMAQTEGHKIVIQLSKLVHDHAINLEQKKQEKQTIKDSLDKLNAELTCYQCKYKNDSVKHKLLQDRISIQSDLLTKLNADIDEISAQKILIQKRLHDMTDMTDKKTQGGKYIKKSKKSNKRFLIKYNKSKKNNKYKMKIY